MPGDADRGNKSGKEGVAVSSGESSAALPKPALSVQGTTKTFTGRGDTGKETYRRFCPECGTGLIDEAEIMPEITMVLAGTLDDATWVKPAMEIYTDSAQPWVQLGGERQRFPKMPPAPG